MQAARLSPQLRELLFDTIRGVWNQPLVDVALPASLTRLHLASSFNQVVEAVAWPRALTELKFAGHELPWVCDGVEPQP